MDEIIAACKTGDKSAQKQLFATYAKGMLLLCSRYVKDGHHAEELMMNGFYKFFSTIERFHYTGKDSVSAWMKRIMVNECLMFLRERKSIRIMAEEQAADCVLDETVFASISAQEIVSLIDQLPEGYRTVFNLFVIEGYSHKEIAALLRVSEGTSKSQLNKAKQLLQKVLEQKRVGYEK
ncbi:MAG TPA: sigma-70 family RNA polymerase sigma factor [Chitinophagaceae bacterium]|nr:sigma-70 family RNA polymerase sigma factor [Chitinophagaceae bacterium]